MKVLRSYLEYGGVYTTYDFSGADTPSDTGEAFINKPHDVALLCTGWGHDGGLST
jgi:hypothetical protein